MAGFWFAVNGRDAGDTASLAGMPTPRRGFLLSEWEDVPSDLQDGPSFVYDWYQWERAAFFTNAAEVGMRVLRGPAPLVCFPRGRRPCWSGVEMCGPWLRAGVSRR